MVKSEPVTDNTPFNDSFEQARKLFTPKGKNLGKLMAINKVDKPEDYEQEFRNSFRNRLALTGGECFYLRKSTSDKKSEIIWIRDSEGKYLLEKIVSTLRLFVVHYPSNFCAVSDLY